MSHPGDRDGQPAQAGVSGGQTGFRRVRFVGVVLLVVGIPLAVILLTFAREWVDIDALSGQNPLSDVANGLMERMDSRIAQAERALLGMATDPALVEAGADLSAYNGFVTSGPFLAVGYYPVSAAFPGILPADWSGGWPASPRNGHEPVTLADGRQVLVLSANNGGRRVVGLFDLQRVLGRDLVNRMHMANWGQVFLATRDGRIFLSANRELVGMQVADLPMAGAQNGQWVDAQGEAHFMLVQDNPGLYPGAQKGWKLGLSMPARYVTARAGRQKLWVGGIISVIVVISAALALVLRHSVRGRARTGESGS